jgi:hypothetical protein
MMDRRNFMSLGAAAAAGVVALGHSDGQADAASERDHYELRKYHLADDNQRKRMHAFLEKAFIPACNRNDIPQVGVFEVRNEDLSPIYVLIRHTSADSFTTATKRLLADAQFVKDGDDVLNTDAKNPAYTRIESQFMISFDGMTKLEHPQTGPDRVFELRNYQSHSVVAGQKKIEMFNVGEIQIMRDTGLGPVLYGEHLSGTDMPNLTYFLSYENFRARGKAWQTFGSDPAWKEISGKPEYANDRILSDISNLFLVPTSYSQV